MPTNNASAPLSTPLWLELRKEYIDDNFDKLLVYLKDYSMRQDSFYKVTLDLLRSRIEELVHVEATRPLYAEADEKDCIRFRAKLLAAYLLVEQDTPLAISAYVALMDNLRLLVPERTDEIVETTLKRLRYKHLGKLSFSWGDLTNFTEPMLEFHLVHNNNFNGDLDKSYIYQGTGTACLTAQGLYLCSEPEAEALRLTKEGTSSLDTKLGLALRTASNDKLKQSLEANIPAMDQFVKEFVRRMEASRQKETKPLRSYCKGDECVVRVTGTDWENIFVETTAPDYRKIRGRITFPQQTILYYRQPDFVKELQVGDCLQATLNDVAADTFDIKKQFVSFVVEDCRDNDGYGEVYTKMIWQKDGWSVWMDAYGTPFYTLGVNDCQVGDYATLQIQRYQSGQYYGKIDTEIKRLGRDEEDEDTDSEEEINLDKAKSDCIRAFVESTPQPKIVPQETVCQIPENVLRLLVRMIFGYQKTLMKPSERFCALGNANVMAEMTGDNSAAAYIRFASTYLKVLVQFASNEPISGITLVPEAGFAEAASTRMRLTIIDLLKEYGRKEDSEKLVAAIDRYKSSNPTIARLARLIQTANAMQDTLSSATINLIRREIIRTLSLETADDTDLEAEGGTYLGIESGTQEFKSSFVYPSDNNMQPNETVQERNVFKGVCAFLNSTIGGTLYLGVNDQGYVVGLENDFKHLRISTMDSYIRHIQDRAKRFFDLDGITYLTIEPMYDERVVAIHVSPHPYRVVDLEGRAYIRVNSESREMPEKVKLETIAKKSFLNKDKAAAISNLQQACSKKKVVVLHNYSSSHTQTVTDRTVEAYDIRPSDNLAVCYDCGDGKCKIFNFNRIGYVEITADDWKFENRHQDVLVDAFHLSGSTPIEVSLTLDLMAKNLLCEEYPNTKDDLKQDRNDENRWFYNGTVYGLEAIGRFYIGLANHIKINNCPQLQQYVKDFLKKNFASLLS